MAKLTYRNERGKSLVFGDDAPFLITKIDGLGSPQNEIYRNKSPNQDGTTATHSTLDERNLVLEGVIIESDILLRQENRDKLIEIFNPKLKGELIFKRDGKIKRIDCIPELAPGLPSNMQENYQMFMISLLCPNPYWKDVTESKKEVALWKGMFHFPLVIPQTKPIIMGYREPNLIVNINNRGHVKTGMKIEFKARGTLENPSLFNINTREFIKINKSMVPGEKIIINTNKGNKKITSILNGVTTDILNYIDIIGGGKTFLQLESGDNLLRYNADDGLDNLEVNIYYNNNYLGV